MIQLQIENKVFHLDFYPIFEYYYSDNGKHVEPQTRDWFLKNLKKNDIIFDIGSHVGLYSILFSQKSLYVYSFEPTDTYEKYLIPNLQKNNITSVKTEKLGFGNKHGSLIEKIYKIWEETPIEDVFNFTTLDVYSSVNKIIPNFIKIDADGYDYEILLGGFDLLLKNNIVICVEVNHALETRGYTSKNIFDLMNELNYENFLILDTENYFFRKKNG
jgi:FkbM family methyltransferase